LGSLAKGVKESVELWWGDSEVWSDSGSLAECVEDSVELGLLNEDEADPDLESDSLRESLRDLDDSESEFTGLLPVEEEDFEERVPLMTP
jgi:hypothetical protein